MTTSIQDCLGQIPNQFDLCSVAAKRARQLARGATSGLPVEGHKATVQSLMEIAQGRIDRTVLDEPDLPHPVGESQFRIDVPEGLEHINPWRDEGRNS